MTENFGHPVVTETLTPYEMATDEFLYNYVDWSQFSAGMFPKVKGILLFNARLSTVGAVKTYREENAFDFRSIKGIGGRTSDALVEALERFEADRGFSLSAIAQIVTMES